MQSADDSYLWHGGVGHEGLGHEGLRHEGLNKGHGHEGHGYKDPGYKDPHANMMEDPRICYELDQLAFQPEES